MPQTWNPPVEIGTTVATCHPKLTRGRVWCRSCGSTMAVNSAGAMKNGWPKCCGYTMTIDSPEEQIALAKVQSL